MRGCEREFSGEKTSRNTPRINDCDASIKDGKVLRRGENKTSLSCAFESAGWYTAEIALQSLVRSVHLVPHEEAPTVAVEDVIQAGNSEDDV